MKLKLAHLIIIFTCISTSVNASSVTELYSKNAGSDVKIVEQHAVELLDLAFAHIEAVGLDKALADFRKAPWKREANQLHIWGLTSDKVDWFDAGHPEYEGISFDGVVDLDGMLFADVVLEKVAQDDRLATPMTFPHPITTAPSVAVVRCKHLENDKNLCSSAFVE